jgi:hypothetical protein
MKTSMGSIPDLTRAVRVPILSKRSVEPSLKAKCPNDFLDELGRSDRKYFMSQCGRGARLDDEFLHGEVGSATTRSSVAAYKARLNLAKAAHRGNLS